MKNLLFTFCVLLLSTCSLLAQDKQVQGIVFDANTKIRLSRVYIYNLRSNKGIFNNSKGEFTLQVRRGDTLLAALEGFSADTVTIQNQNTIIFYLKRTSIRLNEVVVTDTILSPEKELERTQREYRNIYQKGNSKDIFSVGPTGAGLSIDALYSLLSKEGKNARYLQEIIERDYRDAMINYRFSKGLVNNVTGLTGEQLEDFMSQYKPSYYFILDANDYALIKHIKESYKKYQQNPAAHRLPPLKE